MSARPKEAIRLLIADGDPRVGRALGRLLQGAGDVEVVATATDGAAVLALADRFQPGVVIVDARLGQLDGLAITRDLRQAVPALHVVVVSVYATFRDLALAAGACQFLLKDCSRDELVAAIRQAAQGHCQAHRNDEPEQIRKTPMVREPDPDIPECELP
jgi:DNA-binding NarL/FixJ family response regulator